MWVNKFDYKIDQKMLYELAEMLGFLTQEKPKCLCYKTFLKNKINNYKEKQRLIKLAEDVEKGKKLKREK
jgi:hypothetical protein